MSGKWSYALAYLSTEYYVAGPSPKIVWFATQSQDLAAAKQAVTEMLRSQGIYSYQYHGFTKVEHE